MAGKRKIDAPSSKAKYFRGMAIAPSASATGQGKFMQKKSTQDEDVYNTDEAGYDICGWLHVMLPKINANFQVDARLKRISRYILLYTKIWRIVYKSGIVVYYL